MIDEKTVFRMIRYFAVTSYELYRIRQDFNSKFNIPSPQPEFTIEQILQNICKDFGFNYDVVKEHCDLEEW